ncbi:hypothetical protein Bca101_065769 [Brassica carinata]
MALVLRNADGRVLLLSRRAFSNLNSLLAVKMKALIWALKIWQAIIWGERKVEYASMFTNCGATLSAQSVIKDNRFQFYVATGHPAGCLVT